MENGDTGLKVMYWLLAFMMPFSGFAGERWPRTRVIAVAILGWGALTAAAKPMIDDTRAARAGTFEEMVPMPDGTKLYTYGVRPAEGVKCPIVIKRNPYVKERRVDLADFGKSQAKNLARGYAYLVQHCRGCGMSEGDWIPYGNVKGLQSAVREPKVAHNTIDAARSSLVLPCSAARTGSR